VPQVSNRNPGAGWHRGSFGREENVHGLKGIPIEKGNAHRIVCHFDLSRHLAGRAILLSGSDGLKQFPFANHDDGSFQVFLNPVLGL
jgi:hypothetical protein